MARRLGLGLAACLCLAACGSNGVGTAAPVPSVSAVATPAVATTSTTSDLCQAVTYAAPAASAILRSARAFAGTQLQPATAGPAVTGQAVCDANADSGAVAGDTCITQLLGVLVTVYDADTALAVKDGTVAASHPLAQTVLDGRYHVQVELGGFVSSSTNVTENGASPACAADAQLASKILDQIDRYYRPAPIA